ncbi:EamA family transporter [Stenotrophomonas sp. T8]|uniref:EamA family transporter n=1 Tax=Stenotrophomonas sp. T8 TaxID=3446365 RepID=UPI001311B50B
MSRDERVTLLSAFALAGEIILIGHYAGKVAARRVTTLQLLAGALFTLCAMPFAGESIPAFSWVWLGAAASLGAASMLIQFTMNWAQKTVSPTRATVIYASESVWGGIIGRIAGERHPGLSILWAALIVIGVIVSELKPSKWRRWRTQEAVGPID